MLVDALTASGSGGGLIAGSGRPPGNDAGDLSWVYSWIPNYLKAVKSLFLEIVKAGKGDAENVFAEALARVFNYFGEELQHNRFDQAFRAKAMRLAMEVRTAL